MLLIIKIYVVTQAHMGRYFAVASQLNGWQLNFSYKTFWIQWIQQNIYKQKQVSAK